MNLMSCIYPVIHETLISSAAINFLHESRKLHDADLITVSADLVLFPLYFVTSNYKKTIRRKEESKVVLLFIHAGYVIIHI